MLIGAGVFHIQAQTNLIVSLQGSSEQSYTLTSLKKITFANGNILLTGTDATQSSFALTAVNKMYFGTPMSGIENNQTEVSPKQLVYPNPAKDIIYILTGNDETASVSIYNLNGIQMMQTTVKSSGETVDVSALAPGLYIIKVNNKVLKLRKL